MQAGVDHGGQLLGMPFDQFLWALSPKQLKQAAARLKDSKAAETKRYSASNGGMQPDLKNPLGARALDIYENGRDTLYGLHGINEPESIGMAVSSGCIRLLNQHIIQLYNNVRNGTSIVAIPDPPMSPVRL